MVADYDLATERLGSLTGLTVLEYGESAEPGIGRRGGMAWVGDNAIEIGQPVVDGAARQFVRAPRWRDALGRAPGRGPRRHGGPPRVGGRAHRRPAPARDVLHRPPRHGGRLRAMELLRARRRPAPRRPGAGGRARSPGPRGPARLRGGAGRGAGPGRPPPGPAHGDRRDVRGRGGRARPADGWRLAGRLHARPLRPLPLRRRSICGGAPTSGRAPTCWPSASTTASRPSARSASSGCRSCAPTPC